MVEVKPPTASSSSGPPTGPSTRTLTVGEVAARAGVATSALRFYEANGLISSTRTAAGHRRYRADVLRRVGFIRVAQRVGLTLGEIRASLDTLPDSRTPTRADWAKLAQGWKPLLDERIALLEQLQDKLDGCIGCGCLSLDSCQLYNPEDAAQRFGAGPRWLLGDPPATPAKEAPAKKAPAVLLAAAETAPARSEGPTGPDAPP